MGKQEPHPNDLRRARFGRTDLNMSMVDQEAKAHEFLCGTCDALPGDRCVSQFKHYRHTTIFPHYARLMLIDARLMIIEQPTTETTE